MTDAAYTSSAWPFLSWLLLMYGVVAELTKAMRVPDAPEFTAFSQGGIYPHDLLFYWLYRF